MWQKYHKSPFLFSTLFIYLLNAFSLGFPQKKSCAERRAKASVECVAVRMRVYYIFHAL